jgi:hypothetical protein
MNWLWNALKRLVMDPCEIDLMVAVGLLRAFPRDIEFEPALCGFGNLGPDQRWRYDAITYLVSTGRFAHRGLSLMYKYHRRIPHFRGFVMVDAFRRGLGMTPWQIDYLFAPSQYGGDMTPARIADRLERYATQGYTQTWPAR